MKKQSEFGKIKGVDLLNALYYFIGAVATAVIAYLEMGRLPSEKELIIIVGMALVAPVQSLFKRAIKNSDGELLKKEKKL